MKPLEHEPRLEYAKKSLDFRDTFLVAYNTFIVLSINVIWQFIGYIVNSMFGEPDSSDL